MRLLEQVTLKFSLKTPNRQYNIGLLNNGSKFQLYDVNAGANRLEVDTSGNVGIAGSPSSRLTVNDSGVGAGTSAVFIDQTGGINDVGSGLHVRTKIANSTDTILKCTSTTSTTTRFVVRSDGNVGIGTTGPQKLLHLSGATTSAIKFTNGTTGTGATDGVDIDVTGTSFTIQNHEDGQFSFVRAGGTSLFRITTSAIDGTHLNAKVVIGSGSCDTLFVPGMYRVNPNAKQSTYRASLCCNRFW